MSQWLNPEALLFLMDKNLSAEYGQWLDKWKHPVFVDI